MGPAHRQVYKWTYDQLLLIVERPETLQKLAVLRQCSQPRALSMSL